MLAARRSIRGLDTSRVTLPKSEDQLRCGADSDGRILTLPSGRRSPTRQVLKSPQARAGSEIGAPGGQSSRGQCQDAPGFGRLGASQFLARGWASAPAGWGRHPCLPVGGASLPRVPGSAGPLGYGNGRQGCRPNWQARMPAPPRLRACGRRLPRAHHPCLPKVAGNCDPPARLLDLVSCSPRRPC